MKKSITVGLWAVLLGACASNPQGLTQRHLVLPQKDGSFKAVASDQSAFAAESVALNQASVTCAQSLRKRDIISKNSKKVDGVVTEDVAVLADMATEVARQSGYASPLKGADLTDKYISEVHFRCVQ